MENQKLTEEEIQKLTLLREKSDAITVELGQIEIVKYNIKQKREDAERFLQELKNEEQELSKALIEKYGVGNIDIENGEFIPIQRPTEN